MKRISKYSWTIYPKEGLYIKKMDKSTFLHHGTMIAKELKKYFEIENLKINEKRNIEIRYFNEILEAHIEVDNLNRARLMWKKDLSHIISTRFPKLDNYFRNRIEGKIETPEFRLKKIDKSIFELSFIYSYEITEDINSEISEESDDQAYNSEGTIKSFYGKRYERNPKIRKKAIEIHGLECKICGFNYEKVYGELGSGYIEIHHINPLSEIKEDHTVNPETDLIPVCSNCHRMLHRDKYTVLSIKELKMRLKNSIK